MAVNPDRVKKAYDAISTGDLRTLQLMVRAGVPADFSNPDRSRSLLSHAARCGQQEAFQWLIESGADPTFRESCSWRKQTDSLLECACGRNGSSCIVLWLLQNTAIDKSDLSKSLLTLDATSETATVLGRALLEAGADPDSSDDSNETAIFKAVCESAEEYAILLLNAGASPNVRSKSPHRGKFTRKTAFEVGKLVGLERFCQECLRLHPVLGQKRPKIPRPQNATDCWEIIDSHLNNNGVHLRAGLGDVRDLACKTFSIEAGMSNASIDCLIESWSLHNGSSQVGLFPEADDIAYLFMSVEEAADARRKLMEVEAMDSPSQPSLWRFKIPVAENTAGDYLVIELGSGKDGSISQFSHETTRFRKTAKTFLALLQRVAVEVAQGNLCYDRDSNALA